MKKDQPYRKEACDNAYHAACAADQNCFDHCAMPCPYDKRKSPCEMCGITGCEKTTCDAYGQYNKKEK